MHNRIGEITREKKIKCPLFIRKSMSTPIQIYINKFSENYNFYVPAIHRILYHIMEHSWKMIILQYRFVWNFVREEVWMQSIRTLVRDKEELGNQYWEKLVNR